MIERMTTYVVSYDLTAPGRDYAGLIAYLKSLPSWWHHLGSTWVVVTGLSATELRDAIRTFLDDDDKALVVKSSGVGAWRGFTDQGSGWLRSRL